MGFRMETKEGVFVYATDNEPGDALFDKNVRKLAAGADVLIYDAQYLPEEYEARTAAGGTAIGAKPSTSSWRAARRIWCCSITIPIMMMPASTKS